MKTFSDFLNHVIGEKGQGTLADEIQIDGSLLSKFRSGQGSINIHAIDKMFEVAQGVIVQKHDLKRLEDALETVTDLWKEERRKNGNGK